MNPHVKEKSAAALKLDQEKTGSRLTESLSLMRNQGRLETVQEMLPFLKRERGTGAASGRTEDGGETLDGEESVSGSAKGK